MIFGKSNTTGYNDMSKIKIGVFGAARGMTMIHQTLNHPEAELVAICDKYRPLLDECKKLSDEHGLNLQLFEDFEDFFKVDMDAVVLANYANEHAPYAIRLLDSGRHVMSEVLTCQTMKEAVELIEAVERSGKIYAYAENYCYFNTTAEMRRRYKNGDIGDLTHAEGEYVHDCSSIWPQITYGERDHWRNLMHSTFYCTQSLGPILFSTGLRPVSVVGFQSSNFKCMKDLGALYGTSAIELVTLENGATVKSMHGGLKRSPDSINYQMFGTKGCMETDRWDGGNLHVYIEGDRNCVGEHTKYVPEFCDPEVKQNAGHGGSDYFTTKYFIKALAGDKEALANTIDVYTAVDMCICGILAFRSMVNGGVSVKVPNLRNPEERDAYRNDTFCSDARVAGDMYVPANFADEDKTPIPDEVYEEVRRRWLAGEPG